MKLNKINLAFIVAITLSLLQFTGVSVIAGSENGLANTEPSEATSISYDNFSIGYIFNTADAFIDASTSNFLLSGAGSIEGHGLQLGLETHLVSNLYFTFNGSWSSAEVSGSASALDLNTFNTYNLSGSLDFDYFTLNAGTGFFFPISNNTHFVTEVGVDYARMDFSGWFEDVSSDDVGFYASPHIRANIGNIEFHTGVRFTTNELALSKQNYFARAIIPLNDTVDFVVGGYLGLQDRSGEIDIRDAYGFQIGARVNF